MKLIALDTSSLACSVALQLDDAVIERYEEQPREHTRLLLPMIQSVLGEAGVALTELDAIVLGNGPGSFIGMRIGASVAQGLAFGTGLDIVPVSSMAAVAAQVFTEHDAAEVVVAQDARMHEVYLGIYRLDDRNLPAERMPERLQGPTTIVEVQSRPTGPRIAAGCGWQRYPELLAANRKFFDDISDVLHPRATALLGLAVAAMNSGKTVKPQDIVPAYLRQKVAEKPRRAS